MVNIFMTNYVLLPTIRALGIKLKCEYGAERIHEMYSYLTACGEIVRQCGILNISQPYRPPRPVTRIALLYGDGVCFL
jgi:hypothetical protein